MSEVTFGDGGEGFADGDPTLDDVDLDQVAELERRFAEVNAISDPAEQKRAMAALLDEMYGAG